MMELHLESGDLLLRRPAEDDRQFFVSLVTDSRLPDYYVVPGKGTASKTFDWILGHWQEHGLGTNIIEAEHGRIGVAGFKVVTIEGQRYLDMGATISPEHQRRGLGVAIAKKLLTWARDHGHLVCAHTVPENQPALRALAKLGFIPMEVDSVEVGGVVHQGVALFRAPHPS